MKSPTSRKNHFSLAKHMGWVYKNGRYESTIISEIGYYKALQRWTGLTGYNFRKSQVVAMHAAGADISTIAQQTGHQSLETLIQHYLTVSKVSLLEINCINLMLYFV